MVQPQRNFNDIKSEGVLKRIKRVSPHGRRAEMADRSRVLHRDRAEPKRAEAGRARPKGRPSAQQAFGSRRGSGRWHSPCVAPHCATLRTMSFHGPVFTMHTVLNHHLEELGAAILKNSFFTRLSVIRN